MSQSMAIVAGLTVVSLPTIGDAHVHSRPPVNGAVAGKPKAVTFMRATC